MPDTIIAFKPDYALSVACLHSKGIQTGFLSRFGTTFLVVLYRGIGASPFSRIFVSVDPLNDAVNGFVACSIDTKKMYRYVLLRRGVLFIFLLLLKIFNLRNLKFIMETLMYPLLHTKPHKLPAHPDYGTEMDSSSAGGSACIHAELLSIVVDNTVKGRGIGKKLLLEMERFFKTRDIHIYKVITFSKDSNANAFYLACGFSKHAEFVHHGNVMFEYTKKVP